MLVYLLKSTACMGIFLLFYKLLLEKENMHVFKRFYLIATLLIAFVIPSLVFVEYVEPIKTPSNYAFTQTPQETPLVVTPIQTSDIDTINWNLIAWNIYAIGAVIFGLRFLRNLFQIVNRVRKNLKHKQGYGIKVLLLEQLPPHTFFKYIFLNKQKFETNSIPNEVLLHEEIHAKQGHSIDVVFIELLHIVLWFNPLVYIFKKSIKLNHEFLADSAVLKNTNATEEYQNTLLSYLSQDNLHKYQSIKMANAINYSSIKKRFTVMKKQTSKKAIIARTILLLPLFVLILYGFSETNIKTIIKDPINNSNTIAKHRKEGDKRTIELAGLIFDSETILPIKNVEIYNSGGDLIATSDEKGYYKAQIEVFNPGELFFNFSLRKNGYKTLVQNEHWGDLSGKIRSSFYFGLQKHNSNSSEFSELVIANKNLSYESALNSFSTIKDHINFDKEIDRLRKGNQDVFMQVYETYYIVNNTSWIKLNSKQDLIAINDDKIIPVNKLNDFIGRNEITGMTPLEKNSKAKFLIYTDQKKTTKKQLGEYNALAKKYNPMLSKAHFTIEMKDVERLKYLYSLMSEKQKADAEPFPDFPEPPPTPTRPEEIKSKQNGRTLTPKTKKFYFGGKDSIGSARFRSPPEVRIVPPPEASKTPKNISNGQYASNKIDSIILTQDPNDGSSINIDASRPSAPLPPSNPLDYIIKMSKKGAVFFNQGKEISLEVAIEIVKNNKDIDIIRYTNSNPIKISIKPSTIKPSKKIKTVDYAIELGEKNGQFYYNDEPIASKKGIQLIREKKYTSIETLPYVNKKPEVRILNHISKTKIDTDLKSLEQASKRGVLLFFKNKLIDLAKAKELIESHKSTYAIISHDKKYRNKARIDILTDVVDKNNFSSKQYDNLKF